MVLHLSMRTSLVEKWSRNGRRGLPDLAKGNYRENRGNRILPNIYYSLFVFVKGRKFSFFTNLMNSKLISELVSSD